MALVLCSMNLPAFTLAIGLALSTGAVAAAEAAKPALPDVNDCARRDADPRDCVIKDAVPPQRVAPQEPTSAPQLPPVPDPNHCARRDADPRDCVIKDGPPPEPIVRKKAQPQPTPSKPAVQQK